MGAIYVGISRHNSRSLAAGRFYPPEARGPGGRLSAYARHFPTTEIADTYFGPLAEKAARQWAARTPDGFLAHARAYSMLTQHPTRVADVPGVLREGLPRDLAQREYAEVFPTEVAEAAFDLFFASLRPLADAGRLGTVLFCFPPWFMAQRPAFHWLEMLGEKADGLPVAVEFTHDSWLREPGRSWAVDFLRKPGLALVASDAPWIPDGAGPGALTAPFAMVRLSGRNNKAWRQPGIPRHQKRRYAYSREELEPWAARVRKVAVRAQRVFVLFNNAPGPQAVTNAKDFQQLCALPVDVAVPRGRTPRQAAKGAGSAPG